MQDAVETMDLITYRPIGIIRSPFKEPAGMPVQPAAAEGVAGRVELEPGYAGGLKDIDGFSHIFLIYHFHLSEGWSPMVRPYLDDTLHGVFATRAPRRPNAIGISVVRLVRVEGNILYIENVDIADGTPLLDIKPYIPDVDAVEVERVGWLAGKTERIRRTRADERFWR